MSNPQTNVPRARAHAVAVCNVSSVASRATWASLPMRIRCAVVLFLAEPQEWGWGSMLTPAYENLPTKTYSSPHAFPSALRSKRALVQNTMTGDEAAVDRDPVVSIELVVYRVVAPYHWGRGAIRF